MFSTIDIQWRRATRVSKSRKSERSAVRRADDKQATFTSNQPDAPCCLQDATAAQHRRVRYTHWASSSAEGSLTDQNQRKTQKKIKKELRVSFQATVWAWRSMQVDISTSDTSAKVIQQEENNLWSKKRQNKKTRIKLKAQLVQFLNGRGRRMSLKTPHKTEETSQTCRKNAKIQR